MLEFYDFERSKWHKKVKKSFLDFSFVNNSAFPFSITDNFRAALFNDNTINRQYNGDYFEGKWYNIVIDSMQVEQFRFYITDDLFSKLPNNTLVIYNHLFKEEYMRGWRFIVFLFIEFDENGIVKNQYSKIYSETDLKSAAEFLGSTSKELGLATGNEVKSDILISKLTKHLRIS